MIIHVYLTQTGSEVRVVDSDMKFSRQKDHYTHLLQKYFICNVSVLKSVGWTHAFVFVQNTPNV